MADSTVKNKFEFTTTFVVMIRLIGRCLIGIGGLLTVFNLLPVIGNTKLVYTGIICMILGFIPSRLKAPENLDTDR